MIYPRDYEYLWTDYEVNYIFTSCYLFPLFRKYDFVLIYDWRKQALHFFLSKKDIQKLAVNGLKFYRTKFINWKKKIVRDIRTGRRLVKETLDDKGRIKKMSHRELNRAFIDRVKLFQDLENDYFYTEFFVTSRVEQLGNNESNKNGLLKRNLVSMGEFKYQAREVLNYFYNYKKVFYPYICEIEKHTGRRDLQWLSFQEIQDIINGKKILVSRRNKIYWVLSKQMDWQLLSGKRAEFMLEKFSKYFFERDTSVVYGIVVNQGIYQGRVKIIKTIFGDNIIDEIRRVKKNDVLVANTTGPEMIMACRRAGAIVTDEGGLMSHAAIISREFGIPCIVGTKIATQILKDGDLVEVDADNGIIRKIE